MRRELLLQITPNAQRLAEAEAGVQHLAEGSWVGDAGDDCRGKGYPGLAQQPLPLAIWVSTSQPCWLPLVLSQKQISHCPRRSTLQMQPKDHCLHFTRTYLKLSYSAHCSWVTPLRLLLEPCSLTHH